MGLNGTSGLPGTPGRQGPPGKDVRVSELYCKRDTVIVNIFVGNKWNYWIRWSTRTGRKRRSTWNTSKYDVKS